MKIITAALLEACLMLLCSCGSGVKTVEEQGATASELTYSDCVASGKITFSEDHDKVSYHVSASHDKDGNVTSENDAFQSVKAGDSYDFSYNLQELSYMGTIHYGGNKGLGDISQEILSKGDMVLEFTDTDGGTLLKLKLH